MTPFTDHLVVVPQATLQELMVESDERNFGNQPADVAVDVQFELDDVLNVTDTSRVLESTHLTNDAMQVSEATSDSDWVQGKTQKTGSNVAYDHIWYGTNYLLIV